MRKKLLVLYVSLAILILLSPLVATAYIHFQLQALERSTYQYLVHQKLYDQTEIISVKGKLKKLSLYTADVVFSDEMEVTYNYKKDSEGKIIQIGAEGPAQHSNSYVYKHMEQE